MNSSEASTQFFNAKRLGESLQEVAVDVIDTKSENLISRWFHGETGVDLFTWADKETTIIKQQLSFLGQIVEWNCLEGIKTGLVIETPSGMIENNEQGNPEEGVSESIKFDETPQVSSVSLALEILQYVEAEEAFRGQLVLNFENPQNIESLSPEKFMERFGLAVKNYQKQDPGFWENLKRRFGALF